MENRPESSILGDFLVVAAKSLFLQSVAAPQSCGQTFGSVTIILGQRRSIRYRSIIHIADYSVKRMGQSPQRKETLTANRVLRRVRQLPLAGTGEMLSKYTANIAFAKFTDSMKVGFCDANVNTAPSKV